MGKTQNVLICVTRQRSCERLIRVGYERSKTSGGKPYVIHVAPLGENFLGNPKEGEALDYLFDISKQVGAEMTVLRSNQVVEVLSNFSEKHDIGIIVLGAPPSSQGKSDIIKRLKEKLTDMEFIVVSA